MTSKSRMNSADRFWAKVAIQPVGCWLWTGALAGKGYGHLRVDGRDVYAHRFAYEAMVGRVPDGMHIDHVKTRGCTHKNCVNPEHLEPVTPGENIRRGPVGSVSAARAALVTSCPRGHAYDKENTRTYVRVSGRARGKINRLCRACARVRRAVAT